MINKTFWDTVAVHGYMTGGSSIKQGQGRQQPNTKNENNRSRHREDHLNGLFKDHYAILSFYHQ